MSNSFGTLFKITTFGESHGPAIGVIIDGCPANIPISQEEIQKELNRRRPGQSSITTPRTETDQVEILSGIFEDKTTGTPIALIIKNKDQKSTAYHHLKNLYRPSHADFTYQAKYGIRDYRGGGRASARETATRVAAGAIAKKILHLKYKISCLAYVTQIHTLKATNIPKNLSLTQIEKNIVRCPDQKTAKKMIESIEKAKKEGNSLGGIITGLIKNVPAGIGEPVFNKLKATLGHAMLSIPATMGFQIGSGFESVTKTGLEHNDAFYQENNKVKTKTNYSGGIQGGISNGQPIYFDVAFKPTATINKEQQTINKKGESIKLKAKGRHDPCVLPRAVPIIESMSALTILDLILLHNSKN